MTIAARLAPERLYTDNLPQSFQSVVTIKVDSVKTIKVELQPVEIGDTPLHNVVEIRHIGTRSVPDLKVFFSSERSEWVICIEQATDDSGCLFEWVEVATA